MSGADLGVTCASGVCLAPSARAFELDREGRRDVDKAVVLSGGLRYVLAVRYRPGDRLVQAVLGLLLRLCEGRPERVTAQVHELDGEGPVVEGHSDRVSHRPPSSLAIRAPARPPVSGR